MEAAAVEDRLQARVQARIRRPQLRIRVQRLEARMAPRARRHSQAAAAVEAAATLQKTTRTMMTIVPKILTATNTRKSRSQRMMDDVVGTEGEIAAAARTTSGLFAK